jgi:hypothetical protein
LFSLLFWVQAKPRFEAAEVLKKGREGLGLDDVEDLAWSLPEPGQRVAVDAVGAVADESAGVIGERLRALAGRKAALSRSQARP